MDRIVHIILVCLILTPLSCLGAYNPSVEKSLKKQFRDVVYMAHSDCYLVTSKTDKVSKGVCNNTGDVIIPAAYKKISFEKDDNGNVIMFAMGPNFRAESQGNLVYSLENGKILDLGRSEPNYVVGGFITSTGKPIYNLYGNIVLDCEVSSVQPVRVGQKVVGYRVGNRRALKEGFKDELIVCDATFNKLFELEGLDYLWKVEYNPDRTSMQKWKCSKNIGGDEFLTLFFNEDGILVDELYGNKQANNQKPQIAQNASITDNKSYEQTALSQPAAQMFAGNYTPAVPATNYSAHVENHVKAQTPILQKVPDVDKSIPTSSKVNDKTFAVIISNENYTEVEKVPHALNDGLIIAAYFERTLGIPKSNIRHLPDATFNNIKKQINWLKQIADAFGKEAKIIFYYSGHGVPDEQSKDAYLMPIDGYHSDMSTNISINELYKELSALNVEQVIVFMDACFSGSQRGDNMLVAARGVKIRSRVEAPKGNIIVFSAAQGDETAYPYDEQCHGLFTYYLLKKLKESGPKLTLGELSDYITTEVKRASLVHNGKLQTPSTMVSADIAEGWKDLTL